MEMLKSTQGAPRRPFRTAVIALSSAAIGALAVGMAPVEAQNPPPMTAPAATQNVALPATSGYADVVAKVMPAVVSVTTKGHIGNAMVSGQREFQGNPEEFRRFFEEFQGPGGEMFKRFMERFGNGQPFEGMPFGGPRGEMPMAGAGTGFIFQDDGHIATNYHVVANADEITVTLADGREFPAAVVGTDQDTDLAVLKIDAGAPLPYVKFGDSDALRVGDPVIAIGNPFGLGETVTAGIVSAEHRAIGAGRYDDFLQIDAAINHGNSGGPTFNRDGQVVGINTAIHSPTGNNVGIGFAIPSNQAKAIIDQLSEHGKVERGWLGVHIQALDEDLAKNLGLDEDKGALVAEVTPDSPAASAGFKQGDVILSYQGKQIDELRDLTRAVANTKAGTDADVVVWRDGSKTTLQVEIAQMPGEEQMAALTGQQPQSEESNTPKLGLMLAQLTPEARQQFDLPGDVKGVIVTDVQPGSPAAEKGLQPGDVIVEANRKQVSDPKAVADAVREAAERGDHSVLLLVQRDGQDRFVAIGLEHA